MKTEAVMTKIADRDARSPGKERRHGHSQAKAMNKVRDILAGQPASLSRSWTRNCGPPSPGW
jgi:hypothetical protein